MKTVTIDCRTFHVVGSTPPLQLTVSPEKLRAAMQKSRDILKRVAQQYAQIIQEESDRRGWSRQPMWGDE